MRAVDSAIPVRVKVRDVMNSPIISASPAESITDVAKKMKKYEIGSVVVINDDGEIVGMVTDGDIIRKVVADDRPSGRTPAKDVMSSPVDVIDAEVDIAQAARDMRAKGVKRLVVVHRKRPVGIISMSDILNVFPEVLDVLSEKAAMLSGSVTRRRRYVSGFCDECGRWSDYLVEVDGRFLCEECRTDMGREE